MKGVAVSAGLLVLIVTLMLATAVLSGQTVTTSYLAPASGGLTDTTGAHAVLSFTNLPETNNSTQETQTTQVQVTGAVPSSLAAHDML